MQIRVNGEWRDGAEGVTVAALLAAMSLEPRRVAVERNKQLVRRAEFDATVLADRDEIEIVTLVGGG